MAGQVLKRRRLANPRRRRLSNKQIKYFGTPRQKAALKNRRSGKRHNAGRRRNQGTGLVSRAEHAAEQAIASVERAAEDAIGAVTRQVNRGRRGNVGEILTVLPANPGRRKKMATKTRRRRARTCPTTSGYPRMRSDSTRTGRFR